MLDDFPFLASRSFLADRHHGSRGVHNLSLTSSRALSASYDKLNTFEPSSSRPSFGRGYASYHDFPLVGTPARSVYTPPLARVRDLTRRPPDSYLNSLNSSLANSSYLSSNPIRIGPSYGLSDSTLPSVAKSYTSYDVGRREPYTPSIGRTAIKVPPKSPRLPHRNKHQVSSEPWLRTDVAYLR